MPNEPNPYTASYINAGAQLGTAAINAAAQSNINKKTREYNREMYARQREDSLKDWAMQNEYNSPEQQMQRLKQAGLNPHLVYGNGATTTAAPVRSTQAGAWNPRAPQYDLTGVGQAFMNIYDMKIKQATVDNLKAQNTAIANDAVLKAVQAYSTLQSGNKTAQDIEMTSLLKDTTLAGAQAAVNQKVAETKVLLNRDEREAAMNSSSIQEAAVRILRMRADLAKAPLERMQINAEIQRIKMDTDLKAEDLRLKKMNIQPHDGLFTRWVGEIVNGAMSGKWNLKNRSMPDKFKNLTPAQKDSLVKDWQGGYFGE